MSAAIDAVRALLAGDPDARAALPHDCRADAFGAKAFGAPAAAELFARDPRPLSADPHVIQTTWGLAVFDASPDHGEQAVIADLHDGRIARLWRVGAGGLDEAAERGLAVAADPFLSQLRDGLAFAASDHPELDPQAHAPLTAAARDLAQAGRGARRCFVVRAFSDAGRAAALVAVREDSGAAIRAPRAFLAAAAFRFQDGALLHARVVEDSSGASEGMAAF